MKFIEVIDYIEDNLYEDIDNRTLAKIACYSEYHFIRIFKETFKLSPSNYVRKRRLTEIIHKMTSDNRPIYEIAFECGFNSKENFTRAFKKEHHILPSEFKENRNSLKLYDKISFVTSPIFQDPKIDELSPFSLTVFYCDEEYPPNFWNKYNCKKLSLKLSGGKIVEDFGVSIYDKRKCKLDYYIGIRTNFACGEIDNTIQITVGGLYAVFKTPTATHFDFVNSIHNTWEYINTKWKPPNGYSRISGVEFEVYVENSRNFYEHIYIPIQKTN